MQQFLDTPQFEPYQQYRANVNAIQDFAEQSRFCYRIAQQIVGGKGGKGADASGEGQEDATFTQTSQMLLTHCFVMEWVLFEAFLRNTALALFEKYPEKIAASAPEQQLSYGELREATRTFSSIDQLRNVLIARTLDAQLGSDHAVKDLIDFLVRTFRFQKVPYNVEYLSKGQHSTASAHDLAQLRATYLAVLPDTGALRLSPRTAQTEPLPITEEIYLRAKATLHAITASVAQTIDNFWFDPS